MRKHCGNCAVYDRKNMVLSDLCGMCVVEHFSDGTETDPSMWKPMPQTNADRIRAMSDEGLANELALVVGWDRKQYAKAKRIGITKIMLEWLRQPAEDRHE